MRIPICDICGTRIPEARYQVPATEPHSILVGMLHRYPDTCEGCEGACITAVNAVITGRRNAATAANLTEPPAPPRVAFEKIVGATLPSDTAT